LPAPDLGILPIILFKICDSDGTAVLTSQCKLTTEPSGPGAKSVMLLKEVLFRRISIPRNPQAIGELLFTVNIAALGNRTNVLLPHSQHLAAR